MTLSSPLFYNVYCWGSTEMLSWLVISQWENVIMVAMTLDSFSILMKLTSGEDGGTSPKAATVFSVLHSLRWGREASRLWLWIRRGEEASSVASSSGCWLVRVPHLCLDQPLSLFSMQPVLFPPEVPTSGHFRLASYYPLPLHKSIFPQGRRTGFIPSLGIE